MIVCGGETEMMVVASLRSDKVTKEVKRLSISKVKTSPRDRSSRDSCWWQCKLMHLTPSWDCECATVCLGLQSDPWLCFGDDHGVGSGHKHRKFSTPSGVSLCWGLVWSENFAIIGRECDLGLCSYRHRWPSIYVQTVWYTSVSHHIILAAIE